MDIASRHPAMHMSPEQIKQDIAALQTTLTTLTTDINDLHGNIVHEMLEECVSTCKRLATNFQYVDSLLIAIQERAELEHLCHEHERRCQNVQLDDVQKGLDEIKSTLSRMNISPKDMSEERVRKTVRLGRLGLAFEQVRQGGRRVLNALRRGTTSESKLAESTGMGDQKHAG
jgi:type I site-specific restriction endonuclease